MSVSKARVDQAGRLLIPVGVRRRLGLSPGEAVLLEVNDDRLEVRPYRQAVREAQAIIRKYIPDRERSLVDELIEQRREQAERE